MPGGPPPGMMGGGPPPGMMPGGPDPAAMMGGQLPPNPLAAQMGMAPSPFANLPGIGQDPLGLGLPPEIAVMLNDPMVADMFKRMLEGKPKQGPNYPKWFRAKDYPKPTIAEVQMKSRNDKELFRLLLWRFSRDRDILRMATSGVFRDFDKEEEIAYRDASLVFDMQLIQNLLGGAELSYDAKPRTTEGAQDTEKKVDFLQALRVQAEHQHYLSTGMSLAMDEVKTATTYGHLVARILPNFLAEDDEIPISYDLMDISTCFPTWEGARGLKTMTRVYSSTMGQICATWDQDGKNQIKAKMISQPIVKGGKQDICQDDDEFEVIEWWDRLNCMIVVRGVEVYSYQHKFGFVPFVYSRSPLGDAGPIRAENMAAYDLSASTLTRQLDIVGKGLSHVAFSRLVHEQREAILSRMMTMVDRDSDPPIWIEQDLSQYGDTPDISLRKGTISTFKMGYEKPIQTPMPQGYQFIPPMMAALNEASQRGLMPPSAYGVQSNANLSGVANEGMNESGLDKLTPWQLMLTQHHGEAGEMALRFVRDWGHLMGPEGSKGEIPFERAQVSPGQDPMWQLTPQILHDQGIKVTSRLTSPRLNNLMMLGNSVGAWMNLGLMEKTEALKLRGVRDPIAAIRRLRIQEFEDTDEYKKAQIVTWLREEGRIQEAALVLFFMQQAAQPQGGGGPGGPGGMPGAPGSMSPTGQMGGAPPGGPGSGPPMQTGAMGMAGGMGGPIPGPPPSMAGLPPGMM